MTVRTMVMAAIVMTRIRMFRITLKPKPWLVKMNAFACPVIPSFKDLPLGFTGLNVQGLGVIFTTVRHNPPFQKP